jgi:hypothetical protein
MTLIKFRRTLKVLRLLLNPETTYELSCRESALDIRLWDSDGSDATLGPTEEKGVYLDICQAVEVSEKRTKLLHELEAKILSAEDCPQPSETGVYTDDTPAKSKSIKFEELPHPLQDLFDEVRATWIQIARRTLRLLRWRYGKWSDDGLTTQFSSRWENSDTRNWFRCPTYLPTPLDIGRLESGMSYHESVKSFLEGAISTEASEPIGHSLLQQAFELSDARGRIVLAVSAVEIGIKALISDRVPDAEWLTFNLPMPPVEKLIQEYIGRLFPDVSSVEYESSFPKDVIQALRKYVSLRNAIAHRGQEADSADAWKTCDCMRDILYRLDYVAGNKWAKGYWKAPSEYGRNEGITMTPHSTVAVRADIRL